MVGSISSVESNIALGCAITLEGIKKLFSVSSNLQEVNVDAKYREEARAMVAELKIDRRIKVISSRAGEI